MEGKTTGYAFELDAAAVCLDFANTLGNRLGPEPLEEHLEEYGDVVEFARQAGLVEDEVAEALREAAAGRKAAAAVFDRAIALREGIYRVFAPVADGARPGVADVAAINDELALAMSHARVVAAGEGYALGWEEPVTRGAVHLDAPLWPIVRSAMELLVEADLERVGECESDTCGFLFLDVTRNRSRRWCDTKVCGNRARVRRHRSRNPDR
jgi:predicted RNA-binding Zn ribbon-like protein